MTERRTYNEMLEAAYAKLPVLGGTGERFETPKAIISSVGNRTFIQNFKEICDRLNRDPNHVLRFLSRELATAGSWKENYAVFQGRFLSEGIQRLISRYVSDFVTCPVCKRPDTRIEKQGRFSFLACEACGARSAVRSV
ncbi:MAG: translation initiation factor IF-2 subunit beta [Candidatus Bathyarchaeia archaeon]